MAKKKKVNKAVKKSRSSTRRVIPEIKKITSIQINSLSTFFNLLDFTLSTNADERFWFRGHADNAWELTPFALRSKDVIKRKIALEMPHEFKRLAVNKVLKAPTLDDDLSWLGLAQHYGIPTRFLDWSENPAVALYFAVSEFPDLDGCVYMLNPYELNFKAKKEKRILDNMRDAEFIKKYLVLDEKESNRGRYNTIAINPLYNSERILLQRGTFTLHGNKSFTLNGDQASSLICIPILKEFKKRIREELGRIGIDHMSLFPEVEHVSKFLNHKVL